MLLKRVMFHLSSRQSRGKQQKYSVNVTKLSTSNAHLRVVDQIRSCWVAAKVKPNSYTLARPLRSAAAKRLATPPLRGAGSHRSIKPGLFAFLVPHWWKELPVDIRAAETLRSWRRLKTYLIRLGVDRYGLFWADTDYY